MGGGLLHSAPNPGKLTVRRKLSHSQQTFTELILWQAL